MNVKLVGAVIVAVIVIMAVVAAAIVINGDDKPEVRSSNNLDGRLTVFGNANNDDYIDYRDVEHVKAIIAGEETAVYYNCYKVYGGDVISRSFADANCDGKIDEADVDWIQDMVDRKENMLAYFYDVDGVIGSCTYPLTTAAVGYKSNYESLLILDAVDTVEYTCNQVGNNGAYAKWYQMFADETCYGSRFTPDYEIFTAAGNEPPSYILSGTRDWFDPNMEETCGPLGIDVVRLPFYEDNWTVPAVITLGYLTQHEDEAYAYAETADSVYQLIKDTLADVPLEDRPLVFASYNATSVAKMHSGIQELVTLAGGKTPIDIGYPTGSIDGEGIALSLNPDWIIIDQSGPYCGFLETMQSYTEINKTYGTNFTNDTDATRYFIAYTLYNTDLKYIDAVDHSNAYRESKVLFLEQGIYMGPASYIAAAFVANNMYPELFNFDIDQLFADYVNKYHSDFAPSDFASIEYFTLAELEDYAKSVGII